MRSLLLALMVGALAARVSSRASAEEGPTDVAAKDAVVSVTGERIPCEIVSTEGPTVRVRIGEHAYDFDRGSLARVEKAGAPELDPEVLSFVRDLVMRLGHADPSLARAAREGLKALGPSALPYLEAARADVGEAAARALAEISRETEAAAAAASARPGATGSAAGGAGGGPARGLEAMTARGKALLELGPEQEKPFQEAFASFVEALRAGSDGAAAERDLRSALKDVLTDLQMATLKGWLGGLRVVRGGSGAGR